MMTFRSCHWRIAPLPISFQKLSWWQAVAMKKYLVVLDGVLAGT